MSGGGSRTTGESLRSQRRLKLDERAKVTSRRRGRRQFASMLGGYTESVCVCVERESGALKPQLITAKIYGTEREKIVGTVSGECRGTDRQNGGQADRWTGIKESGSGKKMERLKMSHPHCA